MQSSSKHAIDEEMTRPVSHSQYENHIHDLQIQLQELQNGFSSKLNNYHELEESIQVYETQLRKQSNAQNST